MRIAIVDDELIICTKLENMLKEFFATKITCINDFCDGKDFIDEISTGTRYDIVFLDIEMASFDGYVTGNKIRELDPNETIYIVYISCHTENLSQFFKLHPFDFITKPFEQEKVNSVMINIFKDINAKKQRLEIVNKKQITYIPLVEIAYLESYKRLSILHLVNGTEVSTYKKLDDLQCELNQLSKTFYRIHRSYIVNWQYVDTIENDNVYIGNKPIKISRTYKQEFLNARLNNTLRKD